MSEPIYRTIGARVRQLREEAGMTQAYVASRLRPPQTRAAMANIESAKQRVLAHQLVEFAEIFGVSIDSILRPAVYRKRRRVAPPKPLSAAEVRRMMIAAVPRVVDLARKMKRTRMPTAETMNRRLR